MAQLEDISRPETEAELFLRWSLNPISFVREAMGAVPEVWQAEVLGAIGNGETKIAIRSGHGVGKTTLECWVILWFLLFRRPCKIPVTANTQDQLRDILWAELKMWHGRLHPTLADRLEIGAERAWVKGYQELAFAALRVAREEKPEALQGFHSDNMLVVADEASGIPDIIFETASGALTGDHVLVLMAGNPTRISGYFHRAFHSSRHMWRCFHVPCSASSRVSSKYGEDLASEYGIDSNIYRVRYLGEFPNVEDDAVIPMYLIEAALVRDVEPTRAGVVWGFDPARYGDDASALVKRRGNIILEKGRTWRKVDLMQSVGILMREYEQTPNELKPVSINIDSIGLGAGVVDRGREVGLPVRGVNVGERPATDRARFMRLRDELWFKAKDWFDGRDVQMVQDDLLISELVSVKYGIESTGKLKVESKDEMKSRGLKSPNLADAFCLTFAGGELSTRHLPSSVVDMDYDPFAVGTGEPGFDALGRDVAYDWNPFD